MPAAADDDGVIAGFGLRRAPKRPPAFVAGQTLFEDAKCGKAHGVPLSKHEEETLQPSKTQGRSRHRQANARRAHAFQHFKAEEQS